MWKMPVKGMHSNKNSITASAVKVGDCWTFGIYFRFESFTHLKMFMQKRNTAIILNYRNVAKDIWREPQIIKFENAFHIWINIAYICECCVSSNTSVRILQTATYNQNFIVLLLLSNRISQNWSAPDSIRCFNGT